MSQRGRHRAPARHARPKAKHVSVATAVVTGFAVLLTGGITAAANTSQSMPPYVDVAALENGSNPANDIRNFVISEAVVAEKVELKIEIGITQDPSIASGSEIIKQVGKAGEAEVTYQIKLVDGKEVSRNEITRTIITQPTRKEIVRGTGDPADIKVALATAAGNTGSKTGNKEYAKLWIKQEYGWGGQQLTCLETLWFRESNWNHKATNPTSGAYGIPQSLPGRKMASIASDWKTNPATQIKWGAQYIEKRYSTPCEALDFFYDRNWY